MWIYDGYMCGCMCICVYVCVVYAHVSVDVCVMMCLWYVYIHMCGVCVCVYVHMSVYVCVGVCVYMWVCMFVCDVCLRYFNVHLFNNGCGPLALRLKHHVLLGEPELGKVLSGLGQEQTGRGDLPKLLII